MRNAVALEFDLGGGQRGERDDIVRDLLCELTGAEDATVVNNNAAAVLLVLNTLATGREAIVSRGELIEIGGAFRMPEIMTPRRREAQVEVGTTNRTHKKDYLGAHRAEDRADPQGAHVELSHRGLHQGGGRARAGGIAREHKVPLVNDLGSGTLVDLVALRPGARTDRRRGGRRRRRSRHLLRRQAARRPAGRIHRRAQGPDREDSTSNPMKRALRVDKIRLAALEATLRLYRDPDRLAADACRPMRLLARPIRRDRSAVARQVLPVAAKPAWAKGWT